jgi:hypothetical protein
MIMKQPTRWLATIVVVASGLILASSARAQYIDGSTFADTLDAGSFGTGTSTGSGLSLSGTGYNWGEADNIPAQSYAGDNEIIFTYTINSPTPGTTGADYTSGAAWTWYGFQPLINTQIGAGTAHLVRYFGYDGYNLSYGFPSGQNEANSDAGYVYNNGVVTETMALTAQTMADLNGGGTVTFIQLSMDPTSTLPDGYSMTLNSIQLTATPEPTTLALVGLGMTGVMIARRRKNNK